MHVREPGERAKRRRGGCMTFWKRPNSADTGGPVVAGREGQGARGSGAAVTAQ